MHVIFCVNVKKFETFFKLVIRIYTENFIVFILQYTKLKLFYDDNFCVLQNIFSITVGARCAR